MIKKPPDYDNSAGIQHQPANNASI